jgi:hypothetical protein
MENNVYVIYIGIAGIRSEDIDLYVREITKRIIPQSVKGEFITIPIQSYNTRIECINPTYITNDELLTKHRALMETLHVELEDQIKILNEKRKLNG